LSALKPSARQLPRHILYSAVAYSLSFSLTFRLEKITFGLLSIEFINPASPFDPWAAETARRERVQ
jgi:hypothetical protein